MENEDIDFSSIVRADLRNSFDEQDNKLRPTRLADFLGQESVKKNLSTFIEAAKLREEPLDHLLLIGPPGLGKTTLAQITAHELGVDFKVTSAPALDKPKDLAGILSTITPMRRWLIPLLWVGIIVHPTSWSTSRCSSKIIFPMPRPGVST